MRPKGPTAKPAKRCAEDGCQRVCYGRGLCSLHYYRSKRALNGSAPKPREAAPKPAPKPPRLCEVDGCQGKHLARGLCYTHYHRQYQRQYRVLHR
jgi:hypothetical protein